MFVSDDRVLVVDETDQRIWYLNGAGQVVGTTGRRGSGPGEFVLAERIVRMDDSTFGVIDRPNGRLTWIRTRQDSIFATGSIPLDPNVEDGCRLGDALFLARPDGRTGTRVTVAGLDGTMGRTFAPVPPAATPLLREAFAQAVIGCLPEEQLLIVASHHRPEVVAYDPTGRERWRTTLPDFRAVTIEAVQDGARRFTWRLDGNSANHGVVPMGQGRVGIATLLFWVGPARDTATLIGTRYELDARTGRVLRHADGPERLLDVRGSLEIVTIEEPEPAVIIRRRR